MDRGTAMPAVVLDVYKCGKDLIPGWNAHDARRVGHGHFPGGHSCYAGGLERSFHGALASGQIMYLQQLAESHLTRPLFGQILRRVERHVASDRIERTAQRE